MPKVSEMRARRRYEFPRDTPDTERILTVLGGESVEGKSNADLAHLRMSVGERVHAVSLLLLALKIIALLPRRLFPCFTEMRSDGRIPRSVLPPTFPVGERGYRTSSANSDAPYAHAKKRTFFAMGISA